MRGQGADDGGRARLPVVERRRHQPTDQQRRQHVGNARQEFSRRHARAERGESDARLGQRDRRQRFDGLPDREQEIMAGRNLKPEELRRLRRDDEHADAGRVADHHGMRDEIDDDAELEDAERQFDQARHDRQRHGELDVVGRAGRREGGERGRQNERGRRGGAGDQMPRRPEEGGHDRGHDRGVEPVLRRHSRDGREGDALRQHDDGAGEPRQKVGARRTPVDQRRPPQEREKIRKSRLR